MLRDDLGHQREGRRGGGGRERWKGGRRGGRGEGEMRGEGVGCKNSTTINNFFVSLLKNIREDTNFRKKLCNGRYLSGSF